MKKKRIELYLMIERELKWLGLLIKKRIEEEKKAEQLVNYTKNRYK